MAILHWHTRNLPHIQCDDTQHFITFCTRERLVLPPPAREIVLECCRYEHGRRAHVYALVVMPEHVHMVMSASHSISEIMHTIKSVSAHRINKLLGRTGALWQEESFDHAIRSDESLNAKMAYILANPVRRGLVKKPRAYRWVGTADPEFMERFI